MSELLKGTIAVQKLIKSAEKWDTYEIGFPDGSVEKIAHPKDLAPLQVGDHIECKKGTWNWYTVGANGGGNGKPNGGERAERPHREEQSTEKKYNYTAPAKSTGNDRESYWQNKAIYEETVRDKKIERQTYIRMAVDAYNAGLAFQTEIPNTPEEINAYFQMAVDLGESVYQTMSKK